MTLLSIVTDACALAPIAAPQTVIGNTDETAVLCLALANRAGNEVSRKPPGGWVSMIREFDFTSSAVANQTATIANVGNSAVISGLTGITDVKPGIWIAQGTGIPDNAVVRAVTASTVTLSVPATSTGAGSFSFGQSDYPLPADFERSIDNTFWDRSRFWSMRGPQSPQQWQLYKSSVIGRASIQRRFRFRSIWSPNALTIGVSGVGDSGIGNQSAYRKHLSIDPTPFDNGAQFVFEFVSNGWCQSVPTQENSVSVPQSSWQADTDVGIDTQMEYLISLNLQWRLLRRLGLSYSEELDEYLREVDKAASQDGGAAILDLTPSDNLSLLSPWNVPDSGYGNMMGSA